MSNAIVTVIMATILLVGVSLFAQSSFRAVTEVSDAWKGLEDRSSVMAHTRIESVGTSYTAPNVDVTVENTGEESVSSYAKWDVMVQYYEVDGTFRSTWVPYTTATVPGDNQWTVTGLRLNAATTTPEVFQPNILDPTEALVLRVKLAPSADAAANNLVIVSTPNGVSLSAPF